MLYEKSQVLVKGEDPKLNKVIDDIDKELFKIADVLNSYHEHNHDDRYYTETEIDNFFEGEAGGKKQVHWDRVTSKPSTFPPDSHALVGSKHTASGLTVGHFLRATGADSFDFQAYTPPTQEAFPVNSVFISVVSTNPNTLLGYGTWVRIAEGKMLVGQDSGDGDFDEPEETGGQKAIDLYHRHYTGNMVTGVSDYGITHSPARYVKNDSATWYTDYQLSATQSVMNPYFVVYIWKRTA